MRDLHKFYFPESIIVFGVSDKPGNLGREVVKNLNRFGFRGAVYGLGRNNMEIEGRAVFADISLVPGIPDLAVFLVPAAAIMDAMEQCATKGIKRVVIETAGFTELGSERRGLEEEIVRVAAQNGITCMGPNCIGVINRENGVCTPFVPFDPGEIRLGTNGFIAQSGGLLHEIVRRCAADNVGLSRITSMGNKLLLNENELLPFHVDDPGTDVVGVYLESIIDGRQFMRIVSVSAKPVIVLKGNSSPTAHEIARFHTAALIGDEAVTVAALKQCGAVQVSSPQEMVDCFKVFGLAPLKGSRLVLVSRSGGQSVLLADEAHRFGFDLAELPAALFDMIGEQSKGSVIKRTNPIDLGDVYDESFYLKVIDSALEQAGVDGVVFFFDYELNSYRAFDILDGLEDICRRRQKPVVLCMVPDRENWFKLRRASTFPFFTEPERGFAALRRSLDFQRRRAGAGKGNLFCGSPAKTKAEEPVQLSGGGDVSASEALSLVQSYGIRVIDYEFARNREEAIAAARRIGYPVVLKQAEPPILHKTEAGAVRLGISDDQELSRALDEMRADVYMLQKEAPFHGIETIIGGKKDAEFGAVVMFGLGGIFVETLRDVAMRVAPIDETAARGMIEEIKGFAVLKGTRGNRPADLEMLARTIADVSRMLADHPEIENLDINPFVVYAEGNGGLALDVKIAAAGDGLRKAPGETCC